MISDKLTVNNINGLEFITFPHLPPAIMYAIFFPQDWAE